MYNKLRVGIITFHSALNYGAVLQGYALCRALREMGAEAEIIDYRCKAIQEEYCLINTRSVRSLLKSILSLGFVMTRKRMFGRFLKNYKTDLCFNKENISQVNGKYHIITGSDQVWNPLITKYDSVYLLDFVKSGYKVAYAASLGFLSTNRDFDDYFQYLHNFDRISVREEDGEKYVKDMCMIKDVKRIIDPTFLLNRESWFRISEKAVKRTPKCIYILLYMQGRQEYSVDFAKRLAKEADCKIIAIHGYVQKVKGCINIRNASPEEFLNLIYYAKHVVTTSYHGLALSIILNKSVFYELSKTNESINQRFYTLEHIFDIGERRLMDSEIRNVNEYEPINYKRINQIIEEEQFKAKSFWIDIFKENQMGEMDEL